MEQRNGLNMTKLSYLKQLDSIKLEYLTSTKRDFRTLEDIKVELSNGDNIIIPRGFETDLSSQPMWLWSLLPPFDERLLSKLIHDFLWAEKLPQIERHGSIYKAFTFSNEELNRWNKALSPKSKVKNYLEYTFLKWFGMPYYTKKRSIGN